VKYICTSINRCFVCYIGVSFFEIIQHYYQYLVENMDSDSISHVMVCKQLLADDNMKVINKCSTNSQRNVLLLDHAVHMSASELFAFRDAFQELEHQHYISEILSSGMYT